MLAETVMVASTPLERMRGLLGRPPPARGQALLLEPASQVHTFGMKEPIDVLFCDSDGVVVHVVSAMRPRRVTRWVRGAKRALELPASSLPEEVRPGTKLNFYEGFSNGQ